MAPVLPATCTISSTVRSRWRTDDFCSIVAELLPKGYSLSVVLIGDTRARRLNRERRGKDTPANILTFPLSAIDGEIFLNTARILREAGTFGLTPEGHLRFLLIHGCLHLAGHTHGSTMEDTEHELVRRFNLR